MPFVIILCVLVLLIWWLDVSIEIYHKKVDIANKLMLCLSKNFVMKKIQNYNIFMKDVLYNLHIRIIIVYIDILIKR